LSQIDQHNPDLLSGFEFQRSDGRANANETNSIITKLRSIKVLG